MMFGQLTFGKIVFWQIRVSISKIGRTEVIERPEIWLHVLTERQKVIETKIQREKEKKTVRERERERKEEREKRERKRERVRDRQRERQRETERMKERQ